MWAELPGIEDARLATKVEALDGAQPGALPFGAIRLDAAGQVDYYSDAERRMSGSGDLPRIGLNFFHDIAPCMDNPDYRGRVELAEARGKLDLEFSHIGDFEDRERELAVHIQSAADSGYWIFMRRD